MLVKERNKGVSLSISTLVIIFLGLILIAIIIRVFWGHLIPTFEDVKNATAQERNATEEIVSSVTSSHTPSGDTSYTLDVTTKAQDDDCIVNVTVTDSDNNPVGGVEITAKYDSAEESCTTDSDGSCAVVISPPPSGSSKEIVITCPGCTATCITIDELCQEGAC